MSLKGGALIEVNNSLNLRRGGVGNEVNDASYTLESPPTQEGGAAPSSGSQQSSPQATEFSSPSPVCLFLTAANTLSQSATVERIPSPSSPSFTPPPPPPQVQVSDRQRS